MTSKLGELRKKYEGIKKEYSNIPLPEILRALLVNSRPLTLLLPLLGGLFIVLMGHFTTGNPLNWVGIIIGLFSLVLINAGGNNLSSVYDTVEDSINKGYRPIPKGKLEKSLVKTVSCLLFFGAITLAWFVNFRFLVIVLVLVSLTGVYSLPPIRIKEVLWVNVGWQAFIRSFMGVFAAWSILASPINKFPFLMSSVVFLYIFGAQHTKDIPDMKGDIKAGIRTLPIIYGKDGAVKRMIPIMFSPFILIGLYLILGLLPSESIGLMCIIPIVGFQAKRLWEKPDDKLEEVENSTAWVMFYAVMILFYMGFFGISVVV